MRSFCLVVLSVVALANAATQPAGPVYRSAGAVNPSPVTSKPELAAAFPQPSAEARESTYQQGDFKATSPAVGTSSVTNTGMVGTSSAVQPTVAPQSYYQFAYYPAQPQQYAYPTQAQPQQQQPQPYTNGVDAWTKYRMNDVILGGTALGLILAGSYLVIPKLMSVKGRALRELSQLDSEDLSRMAKSVFQAIDKVYEMRSSKE